MLRRICEQAAVFTFNQRAKPRAQLRGRTITKVMGVGGGGVYGEFLSRRNFFSLSNSLYEFFLGRSMNIF